MTELHPVKPLPRILVVDDSVVERNLLVHMVAKWGYPVEFAVNGQEAIELIKREKIQLVLADWQMPGMQGTELCSELRKLDLGHYTYIILMSAQNDEEFLIKSLDAGADDVLSKPVDGNELEARLQSAVRRIELQAQLANKTDELSHAHDVIAHDLRAVSGLQRSYLPEVDSPFPGLNYEWLSVPSKYVSGDHLQVFELTPQVYGFYLLDVSGHGIPAAVKSMQLVQMFADHSSSSIVFEHGQDAEGQRLVAKPRDVVARLNLLFQQTESDLSYFTMIYGVINATTRQVSLCQAGHPSPLLLLGGTQVEVLGDGGYPVGLFDFDEFQDINLVLGDDDALILYSDGVTEVLSADSEAFGEERLLGFVKQQTRLDRCADLPERIQMRVQLWGGAVVQQKGFEDDVSILMLAPRPGLLDRPQEVDTDRQVPELVFRLQEMQNEKPADLPPATDGKSIVIVDDSRSFLRIFEAMLQSWGYTVHAAKNGHEALVLIEKHQPDFVLTDWDMPGMSGIELCEQVRSHKQNAYTYIIMITGYASRDDLLNSLRVGADDFMTKPVNPGELKVRLKTAARIANLHTGLERRHSELSQLYEALQRDMREVSRIQRALLPKSKTDPWPFAIQTLYQPLGYVCGKQMGLLETQQNEHGFFMLSMPGDDTATALQTMALARWFSMARATRVLFPVENTSSKVRRYLASPEHVLEQLSRISPTLGNEAPQFDLLYGLMNLDQGTLLVAGIGDWSMVLAQPGFEPFFLGEHEQQPATQREGKVLYQGVIAPGSRLYFYPQECAQALGVAEKQVWSNTVLSQETAGNVLHNEFSRLLDTSRQQTDIRTDLSLLGLQWRESFEPARIALAPEQLQPCVAEFQATGLALKDEFSTYPKALKPGEYLDYLAFSAVADTVNIGVLSNAVRAFVEGMAYPEDVCYNTDLVVSEALTNVMVHGFKGSKPAPVQLTILAFQQCVGVLLEDRGSAIPPAVFEKMKTEKSFEDDLSLSELPEGGMGLVFMRMVSQRFNYQTTQQGNRLILLL